MDPTDKTTNDLVEQFGWTKLHVRSVQGDPTSQIMFTVTVNLDEAFGLPELIIFGLNQDTINGMIAGIIKKGEEGFKWDGTPTRFDNILTGYPIELRAMHPEGVPILFDRNISWRKATARPELEGAVQVFWPGKDGKFPFDEGYTDAFHDQPRLDIPRGLRE
jgi:hypothetical protein